MIERILINGCSHSAGSEIEGSGIGEGNYNRDNCFGALLAKKLNLPRVNLALPGASNDYIARTTLFWCLEHPELISSTLFLIHWTGADRMEYFANEYKETRSWVDEQYDKAVGHVHLASVWSGFLDKDIDLVKKIAKFIFRKDCHWEINRYLNILQIQELLKAHGAKYVFRNGFNCAVKALRYEQYYTKIDQDNFYGLFDKSESFFEHCLEAGFSIEGQQYWHHGIDAHEYWADRLYNQIKKKIDFKN